MDLSTHSLQDRNGTKRRGPAGMHKLDREVAIGFLMEIVGEESREWLEGLKIETRVGKGKLCT